MRQVHWQRALKLKDGQIRHAIHSGGQIKFKTGAGTKLIASQLASFFPQMQLIMFKVVFNHQRHQIHNGEKKDVPQKQQEQNESKRHCHVFLFALVNFGVSDDWPHVSTNAAYNVQRCIQSSETPKFTRAKRKT